ncbi:hypothetical protein [Serratia marcescens]|uniref:hypothetical protein n=1 Tax=Serratia marcescens TaxID=615 RepID=UPI00124CA6E9|nr:hypothetical protein [Serratia marcescens]QFH59535.1 hypothetical protein FR888_09540 [Serratia marcescens]
MIEEYIEGIVIGYHGFIDCREVEDVIDGGTFWACEMMYKFIDEIIRIEVTRDWFGQWRNKMRLIHGNSYDVKWHEFHAAFVRQLQK